MLYNKPPILSYIDGEGEVRGSTTSLLPATTYLRYATSGGHTHVRLGANRICRESCGGALLNRASRVRRRRLEETPQKSPPKHEVAPGMHCSIRIAPRRREPRAHVPPGSATDTGPKRMRVNVASTSECLTMPVPAGWTKLAAAHVAPELTFARLLLRLRHQLG